MGESILGRPRRNAGTLRKANADDYTTADISWEGNSLEVLKQWPREIQRDFGMSLRNLQQGERPDLVARPMQSIGQGVVELKAADQAAWYRMIYLARIEDTI